MSERLPDPDVVGVLAPTGRDANLIARLLEQHGITCRVLSSATELARELPTSLGAAVVTEEALTLEASQAVKQVLDVQPAWSDFPLVVMSAHFTATTARPAAALAVLGNVTMLDRPVQTRTLLSSVRAALRGRQKQYTARRAIEERDRFLAMLGHELRNPLGAIMFAAEKMKRNDGVARPSDVETVLRQSRLLSRLVDDLLDVSRVTSGKIPLSRQTLDLRTLADRSLAGISGRIVDRGLELERDFPATPVWVDGDAVRLEQVLTNLLVNAVKYTPDGGRITVSIDALADSVELRVKDTGIGVDPASLTRIFELFNQVDETLDRAQGGLGLGLTLVRTLVELHGGTVEARSDGPGRGTELVVLLPRARAEPSALPPPRPSAPLLRRIRVVVIEDNADMRELLGEMLADDGHTVYSAPDGKRGLALLLDQAPDLALIDIGLPLVDGYQVAEQARRKLGNGVRMVALSGYGQPDDKARAARAGFDAHLTKPVEIDSLRRVMAELSTAHPPTQRAVGQ